jgi:hypothetical protein
MYPAGFSYQPYNQAARLAARRVVLVQACVGAELVIDSVSVAKRSRTDDHLWLCDGDLRRAGRRIRFLPEQRFSGRGYVHCRTARIDGGEDVVHGECADATAASGECLGGVWVAGDQHVLGAGELAIRAIPVDRQRPAGPPSAIGPPYSRIASAAASRSRRSARSAGRAASTTPCAPARWSFGQPPALVSLRRRSHSSGCYGWPQCAAHPRGPALSPTCGKAWPPNAWRSMTRRSATWTPLHHGQTIRLKRCKAMTTAQDSARGRTAVVTPCAARSGPRSPKHCKRQDTVPPVV